MTSQDFVPALGRREWTGLYDIVITLMTREGRWRRALLEQTAPQAGERILDVGCGTGTFAAMLARRAPGARLTGLDPDEEVLAHAARKLEGLKVELRRGFARDAANAGEASFDKVVSSLVFHQIPLAEKRAGFEAMFRALKPEGELHFADYGLQRTPLMRGLFRQVQRLDGFDNTEPNALGMLPELMRDAGFVGVEERLVVPTPTGSISLYAARKVG